MIGRNSPGRFNLSSAAGARTGRTGPLVRKKPSNSVWTKSIAASTDLPCCVHWATILQIVSCANICDRDEGSTLAFAKAQARKLLDAPAEDTVAGLRDRAILSVGLQVGLRRAEIAALTVGDLHQNRGFDSLRVMRKGGRRDALAINPQTAARLRAYPELAGHGAEIDGAPFPAAAPQWQALRATPRDGPRCDRSRDA